MIRHSIDICPDNTDELARRLDSLSEAGAEIINVTWQPRRADQEDQAAAFDTSGSFLIIWRSNTDVASLGLGDRNEDPTYVA